MRTKTGACYAGTQGGGNTLPHGERDTASAPGSRVPVRTLPSAEPWLCDTPEWQHSSRDLGQAGRTGSAAQAAD